MQTRRTFLTRTAGGTLLTLAAPAPRLWQLAAAAAEPRNDLPVLVVIELAGGNDGLNTVVPYADEVYHRSRPTLRFDPAKLHKLDDRVGLHPAMADFQKLYEAGELAVVQNAGYPNPVRSHFRSMEIWHTGSVGPATPVGWLGRAADADLQLKPCYMGDGPTPLAVQRRAEATPALSSSGEFRLRPGASLPRQATDRSDPVLAQIQQRMTAADDLARRLQTMKLDHLPPMESDAVAEWTKWFQAMASGNPGYRVFYLSVGGFDTHQSQQYQHERLLRGLSTAVAAFLRQLCDTELGQRVLVLIFSEFGRRLEENGNRGTDHGTGGPIFLAGPRVRGGLVGDPPNLNDLDDVGDPRFGLDFRRVYATVLHDWLKIDPKPILGASFEPLQLIKA